MGNGLKRILIGLGLLALVLGVVMFVVVGQLDKIVVATVEKVGTKTLGVEVTLNAAEISLKSGSGTLKGLRIANPEGFSADFAFELDEVGLDLNLATVTSDEVVVESVVVDGARILFEEKGGRINLQELLNNVEAAPDQGDVPPGETEPEKEGPTLVIQEFRFTNATARLVSEQLAQDVSVSIPDVILRDIGTKGNGVTAVEATQQLLDPLIRQVLDGAQQQVLDQLKKQGAKKLLESLPF